MDTSNRSTSRLQCRRHCGRHTCRTQSMPRCQTSNAQGRGKSERSLRCEVAVVGRHHSMKVSVGGKVLPRRGSQVGKPWKLSLLDCAVGRRELGIQERMTILTGLGIAGLCTTRLSEDATDVNSLHSACLLMTSRLPRVRAFSPSCS